MILKLSLTRVCQLYTLPYYFLLSQRKKEKARRIKSVLETTVLHNLIKKVSYNLTFINVTFTLIFKCEDQTLVNKIHAVPDTKYPSQLIHPHIQF